MQEAYARWSHDIRTFLQGCLASRRGTAAAAAMVASADVDDLVQRTFQRLLESGRDVAPAAVRSWLFRVAFHEAMQDGRRLGVQRRALDRVAAAGSQVVDTPWAEVVRAETVARVRSAVRELPPEQRQVVEDRIYGGKTFARIAADRGVALGTVLTRMRLALGKLARSLRELDPERHDTDAPT